MAAAGCAVAVEISGDLGADRRETAGQWRDEWLRGGRFRGL